ncbi:MAG: hypothetical protein EJNHJLOP_00015 [Methanophagales virus PBV082]|uniref:Uncharacterized protein n=1 Tax=Methanophagales virus PBV082 TaxID=3071307 RepID=A0AA46TER8_9VIRU|nr:MAG: hypothetical protein QIT52_gp15 [Methanophagales virus PBV082]UYL64904.1 MAG: hypothetical protein EJNHJLOP_00015 [Methanophagales virus PBV082]
MRRIALMFAFAFLLFGVSSCKAGTITYDAGTNTITVVGFSESSPCTFEDIYQADVANGWGVVSKQGGNQYYFSCKLQIGDDSTETWLIDMNKMIYEDVPIFLYIRGNGHVRLGKVINSEKKTTSGGCFIYARKMNTYMVHMLQYASIELYSTTLSASNRVFFGTSPNCQAKIWNCNFEHIDFSGNPIQIDVYHLYFVHSNYGLRGIFTSAEDIRLANVNYATTWINQHEPVIMKKIVTDKAEQRSFHIADSTANLYFIDTDWRWVGHFSSDSTSKVYRQYSFNLKVTDEEENPISDAKVGVYDKNGNLEFEEMTDANGQIPEQIITRGYYDQAHGSTLVDFSPHTLVIEKEGYETYTMQFTPSESINWQISLKKEEEKVGEVTTTEVKEERKGKSDMSEGLVLGFGFGIALLAIAFFVIKGGGRE